MKTGSIILIVGAALLGAALFTNRLTVSPKTTIEDMSTDNSGVVLPFYPPPGHVSMGGYLNANVGKELFVIGQAVDLGGEPIIAINTMPRAEAQTLYINGLGSTWPTEATGKNVSILGMLQRESGPSGVRWELTQSSWIPLSGVYSVHQLAQMPGVSGNLQNAVITQLKADGEEPDDFYVDGIEVTAKEMAISVIHIDTLRPDKKNTVGNPSGKDRVIRYDTEKNQIVNSLFTQ